MEPPLRLCDFEVRTALGRGKFGHVYRALHTPSATEVALKVVSRALLAKAGAEHLLQREIDCHSRLAHPHVLPFLGHLADDARVYIVLGLATGGSLFDELRRRGPMDDAPAARVVAALAAALDHAHARGCVHRDVKPENVLLMAPPPPPRGGGAAGELPGTPVLADFGWAAPLDGRRTSLCGTLEYAPPEVLATGGGAGGARSHGAGVDVWALGCLAFELLAGRSPFVERDAGSGQVAAGATAARIAAGEWRVPSLAAESAAGEEGVPAFTPEATAFIARCLAVDPSARPSAAELLADPWVAPHAAAAAAASAPTDGGWVGRGQPLRPHQAAARSPGQGASPLAAAPVTPPMRPAAAARTLPTTGGATGGQPLTGGAARVPPRTAARVPLRTPSAVRLRTPSTATALRVEGASLAGGAGPASPMRAAAASAAVSPVSFSTPSPPPTQRRAAAAARSGVPPPSERGGPLRVRVAAEAWDGRPAAAADIRGPDSR